MGQMNFIPTYAFGDPIGPTHKWFAWRPVRLWYGRWVWLETIARQRIAKKPHLDGIDWEFWSYTDQGAAE